MGVEDFYRQDLAHIHDVGFGDVAADAAGLLLDLLGSIGLGNGMVVDLGCGSGILARRIVDAGHAVRGIDVSRAFIEIACWRVPEAEFRVESFVSTELPTCVAVTAIGEVLGYAFDERNGDRERMDLFQRSFSALVPGGLLMFDLAVRGFERPGGVVQSFKEGPDWAVMATSEVHESDRVLTRRITSFRQVGALYRRDSETHQLQLADRAEVLRSLCSIGFAAEVLQDYGGHGLPGGVIAFLAQKPSRGNPSTRMLNGG
jgi:SAM-dependent methyltransferase